MIQKLLKSREKVPIELENWYEILDLYAKNNNALYSSKTNLTDYEIDNIEAILMDFKNSWKDMNLPCTLKAHSLFQHTLPFVRKYRRTLGSLSEQDTAW